MSTEANKALVRHFIEEGFGRGNMAVIDEVLRPDYVEHNAPPGFSSGLDGVRQALPMFRSAFPDIQITYDQQIAEGDWVAGRYTLRGTNHGSFMGLPPTGRAVVVYGMDLIRCADGKIAERWYVQDGLSMMQQLGVVPAPAGGPA